MNTKRVWDTQVNVPQSESALSDGFLSELVTELDNDSVTAIILRGSYARGDAVPYSDVDLTRLVKVQPEPTQRKQFTYRHGLLISISTRTVDQYREDFMVPERAIFVVPSVREARILLDKEGAFCAVQQEARAWTWEPLQAEANYFASNVLMEHTEYVHKILRALLLEDAFALTEITLELLLALTDAVVVQRGMLVISGNTYFWQVQNTVGAESKWTYYHRIVAGIDMSSTQSVSAEERGVAVLRLYQETVKLLRPILHPLHREVIEQSVMVIDSALSGEEVA
jgi:predicted nucleotidyltransferase